MQRVALMVVLLLTVTPFAVAYDEVAVREGGALSGRIRHGSDLGPVALLPVVKNNDVCGSHVIDESLVVSSEGGLANVVVELEGIHSGKAREERSGTLDNEKCRFVPRVQALTVGQSLWLENSDPLLHDAHAWLGSRTIFNLGLPPWRRVAHRFDTVGLHAIDCNVLHTWMKAWVFVSEHPYVAVTNESGQFTIDAVPAGRYPLRLWHEKLGEKRMWVEIAPGKTTYLDLDSLFS